MSAVPLWLPSLVIGLTFAFCLLLEYQRPLRWTVENKPRRIARNLASGGLSLAFVSLLKIPLLVPVADLVSRHHLGLVNLIDVPPLARTVLAIVLLDYTLWIWHFLNHRVPFLWRFHLVHHLDIDLDASTGLRFHFGELGLSVIYRAVQVLVIGADPLAVSIWQLVLMVAVLFHHANVRLPLGLEGRLVHLLVTPRMHGIHHSAVRAETDSNYSSLLTIWDRLHRTMRLDVKQEDVTIGVPAYQEPKEVTFGRIQLLPFRPGLIPWSRPGVEQPTRRTKGNPSRLTG